MTNESQDRPVLSLADQALLKSAISPSDAQVDQTRRAIGVRIAALAAGAGVTHAASSAQATAASTTAAAGTSAATQGIAAITLVKWISAGLLVTAVAGGTVVATRRAEPAPLVATSHAQVSENAPAPPAQPVAPVEVVRPVVPQLAEAPTIQGAHAPAVAAALAAPAIRRVNRQPASATTDLAGELALVRDARQALEAGDAKRALAQLDAHAARYPNAVLRQEALAARALALCATGRQADARRVAAQLARIAPRSPHLIRLADSCAIDDSHVGE